MSYLQIVGRQAAKLAELEAGFWSALKNPEFQTCWSVYRRDMLAAAIGTVSEPTPTIGGHDRTFRLLDRTFLARFSLGLVQPSHQHLPLAVGVIAFFHAPKDGDKPFYRLFFESSANFGTSPFELNAASLSTAQELTSLFESMAETAIRLYFVLPDRPSAETAQ